MRVERSVYRSEREKDPNGRTYRSALPLGPVRAGRMSNVFYGTARPPVIRRLVFDDVVDVSGIVASSTLRVVTVRSSRQTIYNKMRRCLRVNLPVNAINGNN